MQTYLQKHKPRKFVKKLAQNLLINIDYLIVNLDGVPFLDFPESSSFRSVHHQYGTSIFTNRSDIFYKNEKLGVLTSSPRSSIIPEHLAQFQFENHLFYTIQSVELKQMLSDFCGETNYKFKSINRLDICIDKNDKSNDYRFLYDNIINGSYLISGRPKNIQSYYETYKGKSVLNGFQVGKRTSDKIIRCYNKTLSLQLTEKPYINEYYKNNILKNENVWRLEYQLNSGFFRDLKQFSHAGNVTEVMTWGIFDKVILIELLKIAQKGYFEIHLNSGKSQINKEKRVQLFDFDNMQTQISLVAPIVKKLKKVHLSTSSIKKRLAKSLFREYYSNHQDISYIIALNMVLENVDLQTDKKLLTWFKSKFYFYLQEFRAKEKLIFPFDNVLFSEHQNLFL